MLGWIEGTYVLIHQSFPDVGIKTNAKTSMPCEAANSLLSRSVNQKTDGPGLSGIAAGKMTAPSQAAVFCCDSEMNENCLRSPSRFDVSRVYDSNCLLSPSTVRAPDIHRPAGAVTVRRDPITTCDSCQCASDRTQAQ
eukprot:753615-Hanusia_phi.AAC.1